MTAEEEYTMKNKDSEDKNRKKFFVVLIVFVLIVGAFFTYYYFRRGNENKIGVLKINKSIRDFEYASLIEKARQDSSIRGVVLKINSPGGTVPASFQTETSVSKLAREKPVTVSMQEIATSGAYLIASAGDYIYSYEYTNTGSIGVIARWVSYKDYFEEKGVDYFIWKTGKQKDMFAPWRKPTEKENETLQNLVDNMHNELVSRIIKNRPAVENYEDNINSGANFYGYDAVEMNLVDNIGNYDSALNKVTDMAEIEEYKTVKLSEYY